jgi:transposase
MPAERISMRKIKDVLRLKFAAQLSHRQIAAALKVSVGVVNKYLAAAAKANLTWPLPDALDDAALGKLLWPQSASSASASRFCLPDFAELHQQLKRKGLTRFLLWQEYKAQHQDKAYSYTQFCVLYKQWRQRLRPSMRQLHRGGEKLFVDYCGPTVAIVDTTSGLTHQAQIFVAVLGASNYTFAEATLSQSLPDWIASHQRAFEFFGGVTRLVIPDNLKSGVHKACRYEPDVNPTYDDFAAHYGFAVLPARPYKPKDKAKVEVAVQVVERWILARLRHHSFFSLMDLNQAIAVLLTDLNNRPFKKLPGSRASQFAALDQAHLLALPQTPYDFAQWKKVRVGLDYHAEVESHSYSLPHSLIKQQLEARLTASTVEFFHKGSRVASHQRSPLAGACTTLVEHMPAAHRAHRQWTIPRLMEWAKSIGIHTGEVVERLLESKPHPEQGYRSCLGLMALAKRYGVERLESACRRALLNDSLSQRSIASILANGLDQETLSPDEEYATQRIVHHNVRGASYYQEP